MNSGPAQSGTGRWIRALRRARPGRWIRALRRARPGRMDSALRKTVRISACRCELIRTRRTCRFEFIRTRRACRFEIIRTRHTNQREEGRMNSALHW